MQRQYENTQGNGAFRADVYLTHSRKSQTACQEFDFQEFLQYADRNKRMFFLSFVVYTQTIIHISVGERGSQLSDDFYG